MMEPRGKAPPLVAPLCSCYAALSCLMPGSYRLLSLHEPEGFKYGYSSLYFFKVLRSGKFVMSLIKGEKKEKKQPHQKVGEGYEQTLLKRRQICSQQIYEKMVIMICH